MDRLKECGVPSRPYFTPIHLQPFYARQYDFARRQLPNTELAGNSLLALPFSGVMTEQQVDYVCQQLQANLSHVTIEHHAEETRGRYRSGNSALDRPAEPVN